MMKFVLFSCLLGAVLAVPAPDAHGVYGAAPALATVQRPNCEVSYEEIETQNCVPRKERVCNTTEVEQESVTYEKECKEVMSKDCKPERVLYKREAEAGWPGVLGYGGLGYGYGGYGGYAPAAVGGYAAAPAVAAAPAPAPAVAAAPKKVVGKAALPQTKVTIKKDCREVTKEVCVNTPKKESKTVPVTNCHVKQTVDCKMVTKRIPKKNCEPVETTVPVAAPAPHVGGYAGYHGAGLAGRPYYG